ncbi:calcium-binding protein PBP1-like [Panicum virgatum]|uniref:EF-hand domain-containing protein n=1 Tax=Panicum virgatum TaxID=38727 RepID=A0A8T0TWX5_PANVG|nr:calcium-binding protein PBP1-like [Panicum virgatum]KAG2613775.1 hypothetical protein PVAP13_4KG402500 [Panicum virgatum]
MASQQRRQMQQQQEQQAAAAAAAAPVGFEDYLPVMAERLGEEGLMRELASGFRLLMDPARGLITFDSLRRSAPLLGLGAMSDNDLRGMLAEGDFDGDGALSEMEFCALMLRLSPELMDGPRRWLDDAVSQASHFLFFAS